MAKKLFGDDKVMKFAQLLADEKHSTCSIDAILQNERSLLDVGRVAVWYTILEYEQKTDFSNIECFWLWRYLEQQFCEYFCFEDFYSDGPGDSDCFMNNLVINTLNYDRLAEEVIRLWAWSRLSGIGDMEKFNERALAKDLVSHKHGSLGSLVGADALAFGAPFPEDKDELMHRANKLRFWFEVRNEADTWGITNRIIGLRGTFVILGYGYHELIGHRFEVGNDRDYKLQTVVATCYGLGSEDRTLATTWIDDIYGASVSGNNLKLLSPKVNCSGAIDRLFASK